MHAQRPQTHGEVAWCKQLLYSSPLKLFFYAFNTPNSKPGKTSIVFSFASCSVCKHFHMFSQSLTIKSFYT